MLRLINQTLSQIILMCEKQRGILQCWTLINVPGRHGADSVQTQVGLTELWCICIAPNGGEVAELLTTLCYRSPGSSHPLKWSPAKEYKRVKQADWFLAFVPFHKTGVLPSVNAALWTVRSSCPCRQGEHLRPVRRVGVGLQNLLNELRAV